MFVSYKLVWLWSQKEEEEGDLNVSSEHQYFFSRPNWRGEYRTKGEEERGMERREDKRRKKTTLVDWYPPMLTPWPWPCVAEFMLWIQADRNVVVNTHFSSVFCHPISSVCWWIEMISESKVNDAASDFPAWMWHWNNVKAIWVMRWQWDPTSPHLFLFVCFVLCSHRPLLFISLSEILLSRKQEQGHLIIR